MAASDYVRLFEYDKNLLATGYEFIAGVDEAGRGPLAGPVVAGAVILNCNKPIEGLNDSKKLSEKKRDALYDRIKIEALAWAVAEASPQEIDSINILKASLLAMHRALEGLHHAWQIVCVDGNVLIPSVPIAKQKTIVKGDATSACIAAASVMAKVTRDRIMAQYHQQFPEYGFLEHKGYPTAVHRQKVEQLGLCAIHRKSFCHSLVTQTSLHF